jgi:hypothetical protein
MEMRRLRDVVGSFWDRELYADGGSEFEGGGNGKGEAGLGESGYCIYLSWYLVLLHCIA